MNDIHELLNLVSIVFCTVGPILIIIWAYQQNGLPTTNVKYIEDIPKVEGLYNTVETGEYYVVYEEDGKWYRVNTDSTGKVQLSNPKRF